MARKLWDTELPEDMILMARATSEREQVDPEVINELHTALSDSLTASEGVQRTKLTHDSYYDPDKRLHVYDVWVGITTKGGWHGDV